MNGDLSKCSDREILIVLYNKVEGLEKGFEKFCVEQKVGNTQHDERIRHLEISGSQPLVELQRDCKDVSKRVSELETFKDETKGAQNQGRKDAAIVAGIVSAVGIVVNTALAVFSGGRF